MKIWRRSVRRARSLPTSRFKCRRTAVPRPISAKTQSVLDVVGLPSGFLSESRLLSQANVDSLHSKCKPRVDYSFDSVWGWKPWLVASQVVKQERGLIFTYFPRASFIIFPVIIRLRWLQRGGCCFAQPLHDPASLFAISVVASTSTHNMWDIRLKHLVFVIPRSMIGCCDLFSPCDANLWFDRPYSVAIDDTFSCRSHS